MRTQIQSSKAFFLTNTYGRIYHANLIACNCLGYTRDELLDISLDKVYLEATPKNLAKVVTQLLTGDALTLTGHFKKKNGDISQVEMRVCLQNSDNDQLLFVFDNGLYENDASKSRHELFKKMVAV